MAAAPNSGHRLGFSEPRANGSFRTVGPGIQAVLGEVEVVRQDLAAVEHLLRAFLGQKPATKVRTRTQRRENGGWRGTLILLQVGRTGKVEEVGGEKRGAGGGVLARLVWVLRVQPMQSLKSYSSTRWMRGD